MKKTKLNIRFHNPNTEKETIQYIAKIFIAVGVQRLEKEVENYNSELKLTKAKQEDIINKTKDIVGNSS